MERRKASSCIEGVFSKSGLKKVGYGPRPVVGTGDVAQEVGGVVVVVLHIS